MIASQLINSFILTLPPEEGYYCNPRFSRLMHAESRAVVQQSIQGTELSTWLSQSTCELPDVTPAGKVQLGGEVSTLS